MRRLNTAVCSSSVQITSTNIQTVSVAVFNLADIPGGVPNSTVFYAEGVLIGIDGSANAVSLKSARTFKTSSVGALSALGTLAAIVAATGDVALTTVTSAMIASGNQIVLQAVGIAAETITWTGHLIVWSNDFT